MTMNKFKATWFINGSNTVLQRHSDYEKDHIINPVTERTFCGRKVTINLSSVALGTMTVTRFTELGIKWDPQVCKACKKSRERQMKEARKAIAYDA